MSAPVKKCEVCDDTGSRYSSKFLDCTQCGAAVERSEFDSKIYSGEKMSIDDRLWRAYQLGKAAVSDSASDAALVNIKRYSFDPYGMREDLEGGWLQRAEVATAHPVNGAAAPVVPVAAPNDKWRTMCHALSDIWDDSLKWHEDRSYADDAWPEQIKELRAMVAADDADLPVAAQPVVQQEPVDMEALYAHGAAARMMSVDSYKRLVRLRMAAPPEIPAAPSLEAQPAGEVVIMPQRLTPGMKSVLKEVAPKWNAESIYANLYDAAAMAQGEKA